MVFRCFAIVCLLLLVSGVGAEELGPIEVSEDSSVEIPHGQEIVEPTFEGEQEPKIEEGEIVAGEQETQINTDENSIVEEVSEDSLNVLPVGESTEQLLEDEQEYKNEAEEVLVEEIVQEDYNELLPIDTIVSDTEQRSIIVDGDKVIVMWK